MDSSSLIRPVEVPNRPLDCRPMTDRWNTVLEAKLLLFDLLDPNKTPGVPPEVRKKAKQLVDNYPSPVEVLTRAS